ncbi:MAG: caspase family protein [Spirochaetales bacterium]|nr:caspase family protein [Spirochaetales bacterium]
MNIKQNLAILIILLVSFSLFAEENNPTFRRIAIYVGSNNGGSERIKLLYAGTDALALHDVMEELGGIEPKDNHLLFDPDLNTIESLFTDVKKEFISPENKEQRTEFFFYYSGHSDEQGLLLGKEYLAYSELKQMITGMGSDVNIAILDSCSSGVFTRLKGGTQKAPFLVDESVDTTGYAFLTSSSADEAAQESDAIGASFFTHYFISALRGAGDSTQDGKVTLNEAFSFASNETLTRTTESQGGVQHPSYNINLTGSGDLVLTDLRLAKAGINLDTKIAGRIFIKDRSGRLVAELYKESGLPMTISLPLGTYSISIVNNNVLTEANIFLNENKKYNLSSQNFKYIPMDNTRVRGNTKIPEENLVHVYGELGILNDYRIMESNRVLHNFSIMLVGNGHSLEGVQIGLINFLKKDVKGAQIASIFNLIEGKNNGAQVAGIFNISEGSQTFQGAGIFNISDKETKGAQAAGIFNISSGKMEGIQASGIFNITSEEMKGFQGAGIFNINEGFFDGVQASGIFNSSRGHKGLQASLVNVTEDIEGLQVGLVNYGKNVKGVQLGLVNINNEIQGLPIGLINISRRGLSHVNTWQDSTGFTYFGYQVGARNIYTRVFGGEYTDTDESELVTGISLGYHLSLGPLYIEAEAAVKQLNYGDKFSTAFKEAFAPVNSRVVFTGMSISGGVEILGSLAVFGGVAWDGEIIDVTDPVPELLQTDDFLSTKVFNTGYKMNLYQKWFLGFRI